jgi:phospholipid transport system substrate-binding protein
MMARRRAVALVLAALTLLILAGVTHAGAPTDQLRVQIDRVIATLEDPGLRQKPDARRAAVRKIAEQIFDFESTARRSLGRHWQARTPEQRREFVGLFTDLLERAYIARIDTYAGERVTYAGDTVEGEEATVRTRLVTRDGSEVPVDYRMRRAGDRWLVYDVVIEGVSLVANYRSQFNRIIQTSSYEELVSRMRAQDPGRS